MKIIYGKDLADIWQKNRTEFLRLYATEQATKVTHKDLEQRWVDSEGRTYYGFRKDLPVPLERWGRMKDFLTWMSAGLSKTELGALIQSAKNYLDTYVRDGKNIAKIGFILEEISRRQEMVLHTELLYQFLAVQWVREDEDPFVFNPTIQDEKVETFKRECANGNTYFFFRQPELMKLHGLWNFTADEWEKYWQESEAKQKALNEVLKTILSEKS